VTSVSNLPSKQAIGIVQESSRVSRTSNESEVTCVRSSDVDVDGNPEAHRNSNAHSNSETSGTGRTESTWL